MAHLFLRASFPESVIARAAPEDLLGILELQRQAFREEAERVGGMSNGPMSQILDELRAEFQS